MRIHDKIHYYSLVGGILAMTADGGFNIQNAVDIIGSIWDITIASIVIIAFVTVVLLTAAMNAYRNKQRILALGLGLCWILAATFSLTQTLERVAVQRDKALMERAQQDDMWRSYKSSFDYAREMAMIECGTGRGPRCFEREAEMRINSERMTSRMYELDSIGQKLSFYTGGMITPQVAGMILPLFLPFALFLSGNLLIAFGANGRNAPEFDLELTGRDATTAKIERFVNVYKSKHGRAPTKAAIKAAVPDATDYMAGKYASQPSKPKPKAKTSTAKKAPANVVPIRRTA